MKIAWMVDLPAHFCLGIGMAVKVAKNRDDTQPPGDMSADQTLHAATRPRQFSGGPSRQHGCSWGFCWDRQDR